MCIRDRLTLWLQLWLYSVGIGVLAVVTGIVPAAEVSTHYYPVSYTHLTICEYWVGLWECVARNNP